MTERATRKHERDEDWATILQVDHAMRSDMKELTYTAMAVLAVAQASATAAEIKPSEVSRLAKAAEVLRETRTTIPQEYWTGRTLCRGDSRI